ncbi:MAG TPA: protein kinase, partial [Polyangiaceae bacterium]|nr:protein kinase [Polyangiaceae bacterium]
MWIADVVADRFVIERAISRGGMGSVFLARDRENGEPVALKVLAVPSEDGADRFRREVRMLSTLSHPGIVRYVAHGIHGSEPFLVMEWLEGVDLAEHLGRNALGAVESVRMIRKVAEALAFAHARGVIHRDIKPSNIFLCGADPARAKILDFGIARPVARTEALTTTGATVGTVGYMAPEQAMGSVRVDGRADVFALGCVLFECVAGRPAFPGATAVAVLAKVLSDVAPRLRDFRPEIAPSLDDLVTRLLAKYPLDRPADGAAVVALLDELGSIEDTLPPNSTRAPASLSAAECRVVSIVLAQDRSRSSSPPPGTVVSTPPEVEELAHRFGVKMYPLQGRSLMLVLSGRGAATDQAAQAALCALELRSLRPGLHIAVATGRADTTNRLPIGTAIDRAASVLSATFSEDSVLHVGIDDMTAGLLGPRFEVMDKGKVHLLVQKRDELEVPRLLLGKPTRCVGRDGELAHLEAVLEECIQDREPRAVLVTAPAGVGKSRLASEFLTRVRSHNQARVLLARADAVAAGSSLALAEKLVRQAADLHESDAIELQRDRLREYLASKVEAATVDRLAKLLGEIVGSPRDRQPTRVDGAGRNDLAAVREQQWAFDTWIGAESKRPLLIVLEDLHWGDLPTVSYLSQALRHHPDRPLMILALGRPEVEELFPKIWDALRAGSTLQEIRLGGLTRRSAERLVRSVLGDEARPDIVARIVERSDGNAFYLEELIRHIAGGETSLPETVLAMAETRLESLEPEGRLVLRAASVFGEACWSGGVAALLGPRADTEAWLETLVDREFLVRAPEFRFPGEKQYVFRHALLCDAVYAMLTENDRAVAHRLAADWLVAAGEKNASVLAHHYELAREADSAAEYHVRAGDQATRLCSYGEARDQYGACMSCLAQLPEDDAVRRRKVDTLLRLIYTTLVADTAEQNFQRAGEASALLDVIAEKGPLSPADQLRLARVYYYYGRIHFYRAETHKAIEYYRKVLPVGQEAGDDELIGLPSCLIGTAMLVQGRATQAEPLLAQSLGPVERQGDPFEWFRAVGYHGLSLVLLGRYREGVREFDRMIAHAEQFRQASLLSPAHIMSGTTYLLAGDWPMALSYLRKACTYATETGDKVHLNLAYSGVGWASSYLGQHDEARTARNKAKEIALAMGGKLMLDDWYRAGDAEIAWNAGDHDLALRLAETVVESSAASGLLLSQGIAERVWG